MSKILLALLAMSIGSAAFAADCQITVTRTACPGKESESYAKCPGGAQSCSSVVAVANVAECQAAAVTACANSRFLVTKYKRITALLGGVDFARGQDFCDRDWGTYKVSANFPYREKAKCE